MGLITNLKDSITRAADRLFSESEPKRIGIYGPPNAGKCLAANEEILLADGTYRKISDVFDSVASEIPDANDVSDEPHETWLECGDRDEIDLRIPALSEDLESTVGNVTHVFRQRYRGPMYKVETRMGREVTVSPEHPFVSITKNGIEKLSAEEVSEGTSVALLSSYSISGGVRSQLPQNPNLRVDGGCVTYRSKYHNPASITSRGIDPDIARFIALTLSEAQHDERFVAFSNENDDLRTEYQQYLTQFGLDAKEYEYENKTPVVRANSRSLIEHLKRLDCPPAGSSDKYVPKSILTASDHTVRAFLRGIFDCEGSVQGADGSSRGRYVTMSSASRELLVGIQILLLRFGIVGKIRKKPHDDSTYYELVIGRSEQHRLFRRFIGFDIDYKKEQLDRLCEAESNANIHTLPIMPLLEGSREELGMTQQEFYGDNKHVARMRRRNRITVDRIKDMATWLPEGDKTRLIHRLADNDVYWDEIVSIEQIDYDGYIYDLTVADHHTFTTRDGLVVHNTTLANRIARDWTGDAVGPESHIPHETRRARRKEGVEIERNGRTVTIDIVDTPGVTTKVDYKEFLDHDMEKDDAVRRSREATEGVAEAMHWLREDVDGVIYVLDSTEDPFTQVNTMLVGIIESQDLPVLILANKTDLEESQIQRVANAFPQHETIPLSALEGSNMDEVYDKIAEKFG
ncbi:GTP-binding protein [Halalkaliarchaeum desulfuricum]|uniref:GTP-binding protein n=1 Tax=Halalkaliarchaeum desulfuricum TaxID=2055893 RepID=A0A343TP62_9EURY|nr:GTP-binding protein [Halalkaliarchaeum desulfuricum]